MNPSIQVNIITSFQMGNCELCRKRGAKAWFRGKMICQKCWIVLKYGDMEEYIKKMSDFNKQMKGG